VESKKIKRFSSWEFKALREKNLEEVGRRCGYQVNRSTNKEEEGN